MPSSLKTPEAYFTLELITDLLSEKAGEKLPDPMMGRLNISHITLPITRENVSEERIEALDWMNAISEPAKQTLVEVIKNVDAYTCLFTLPKTEGKAHQVRRSEGLKELLEYDAIRQINKRKRTFMLSLYIIWPYPATDLQETDGLEKAGGLMEVATLWNSLPATSPQGIYNKEELLNQDMDEPTDDELAEFTNKMEEDRDN